MAIFYVDRSIGSDSNSLSQAQSQSTPWRSVAFAVSAVTAPGNVIQVKNGIYPELVQMTHSGVAGSPITLQNFPGHNPVLAFPPGNGQNGLLLQASPFPSLIQYLVIQGLEITGAELSGVKGYAMDHVVFQGNYIHDNGLVNGNGLLSEGANACTIVGNRIYKNGLFAQFVGDTNVKGHGLYLYGSNWIVSNNLIYFNARYGIQTSCHPFDATQMTNTNQAGSLNNLIANNTFAYQDNRAGLTIWDAGGGPALMTGNQVLNNLFYENGQGVDNSSSGSGIDFTSVTAAIHVSVQNNIGYATTPGSTAFILTAWTNGVTYDALNNCPTNTANNASCATNPQMVNAPSTIPSSPDFHLTSGSLARGFGQNLTGVINNVDFDGVTRPATGPWDVGAFQFVGPAPSSSPPKLPYIQIVGGF